MQILCYGDSNTYGHNPQNNGMTRYPAEARWVDILTQRTGWICRNRGENGRQTPHTQRELEQARRMMAANADAELVIVMLGTNDLLQGATPQQARQRMDAFLREILPVCRKILVVPPPLLQPGAWIRNASLLPDAAVLRDELEAAAREAGVGFFDPGPLPMAFDGVHLSPEGHDALAQAIQKYLEK